MSSLVPPPWLKHNRITARKLERKRRIKALGLAPVPKTKAEQRALAAYHTLKDRLTARTSFRIEER